LRFGVHVGIGGGFRKSIQQALDAGCDCIQIFAGNPRGWRTTPYDPQAWAEFARLREQYGLKPTIIHTSYLINLATDDRILRKKSAGLVAHDLDVAAKGRIEYVNTHLGSYGAQDPRKGFDRVCKTIATIVGKAKPGPMLLLENSAGAGNLCGGTLDELGAIIRKVGSKRIGVCLDTAHAWASGYDISNARGVKAFLTEIEKHIGFDRVKALHCNDTKVALGARRDLHWHVAQGLIGDAGFRALLRSPQLADAAVICETPKTLEQDLQNVSDSRRLAGLTRRPAKELSTRRKV
jgi:deoxyribonuclease IV